MDMLFSKPIDEVIRSRKSVRTYSDKPVPKEIKEKLQEYMNGLDNPFGIRVSFRLLESRLFSDQKQLGTYGMIKGSRDFVGVTVPDCEFNMEAVGYAFEKLILFAASLNLGTCWLGGTFNRSGFSEAMEVGENDIFPAVSPVGYGEKRRLSESLVRKTVKADQRKPWDELFFKDSFDNLLSKEDAGAYTFPLEMTRLAPSASNKQPWRILKSKDFHFYEYKTPGYSDRFPYDIQRVDMGIAACHFHLSAAEKGLKGKIVKQKEPNIAVPEHMQYCFSWISE